jgi:aryl-alcohol dehydrogenase-like predicted oxidoreductase
MLGTVQFGLNYGIANRSGQPSREVARDIIACAYEGGVNCLDTAAGYGDSEEVLGEALAQLGLADKVTIVSKVTHLAGDLAPAQAAALIEESVIASLRRLRLEHLPICLFHREDNFRYLDELAKLQEKGLVGQIGVSLSGEDVAISAKIAAAEGVAALQLPVNLLDQRFVGAGVLDTARERGAAVFARSVFLQGLLLMQDADVPAELDGVLPALRELRALARAAGLTMAQLCVRFVLGLPGVTCALAGVETVAQMRQNLELFRQDPLPPDLQRAVRDAVPALPEQILVPRRWSQRMPDAVARR